jgi:NAD(P)-dependent dehydrogenase (short-subunit alcohol dehydrogenase family)
MTGQRDEAAAHCRGLRGRPEPNPRGASSPCGAQMRSDLRVALVTGGGTGIGAGITRGLAQRGVTVVVGQSSEQRALAAAARFAAKGLAVSGVGADLATAEGCRRAVGAVIDRYGRIDILVNNAAITGPQAVTPFLRVTDDQLDRIIDVNLKAPFRCARLAADDMQKRSAGVIVNISSVGAYAAQFGAAAYVATKSALVGLTRGLALDLAPMGIRVVGVAPGDIDLAPGGPRPAPIPETWRERYTPLGRRGAPADIAAAVAFLCSEDASFITGETLVVDGGWLAY